MDCKDTNYLIVWDETTPNPASLRMQLAAPHNFDFMRLSMFRNVLDSSTLWLIDASKAVVINDITGERYEGQLADPTMFICGFFVVRGSVENLITRSREVDMSFVAKYQANMSAAALDDLVAHTTFMFAPVDSQDAAIMTVWARLARDIPNIPVDLVMDVIHAYNVWGKKLNAEKVLLDTGRINVRFDGYHLAGGQRVEGRKTGGRLVALGSCSKLGLTPQDALMISGLDAQTHTIEVGGCNGWCKGMADHEPIHMSDPRNEIYV